MNRKACLSLLLMALPLCLILTACGGGGEEPTPTPMPPAQILELTDIFRNNVKEDPDSDYEGPAYVFCRISVEAVTDVDLVVLSENVSHIRDIVNSTMSSKTLAELKKSDAKDQLKAEIAEKIIAALTDRGITELVGVYFTEYYTTP